MIFLNRHISVLLIEDCLTDAQLILQPKNVIADADALPLLMTVAVNLQQATELLQASQFDVVLLDLTLPDAEGLTGLMVIGANFPEIPIVVLTG